MIKPCSLSGSSACGPTLCPHHNFATNQLSLSFKIFTDKAICRGRVLTQRSKASPVEFLVLLGGRVLLRAKREDSPGKSPCWAEEERRDENVLKKITWELVTNADSGRHPCRV